MPTARSRHTKTIFVPRDPIYKLIAVAAAFDRIFSSSVTAIQMPFFTFRFEKLISLFNCNIIITRCTWGAHTSRTLIKIEQQLCSRIHQARNGWRSRPGRSCCLANDRMTNALTRMQQLRNRLYLGLWEVAVLVWMRLPQVWIGWREGDDLTRGLKMDRTK